MNFFIVFLIGFGIMISIVLALVIYGVIIR